MPNLEKPEGTVVVLIFCVLSGFVFGFTLSKVIPRVRRKKFHWIVNISIQKSRLNLSRAMKAIHKSANIMLKSEFCTYYKAPMPCGMNFYIKKLYWSSREFSLVIHCLFAPRIAVLARLNNSNIMSPLAYALSPECALVVYQWPEHGTLIELLHGNEQNDLGWECCYKIALELAAGLAFLHGCCSDSKRIILLHFFLQEISS